MTIEETTAQLKEGLDGAVKGFKQLQIMLIVFSLIVTVSIVVTTIKLSK